MSVERSAPFLVVRAPTVEGNTPSCQPKTPGRTGKQHQVPRLLKFVYHLPWKRRPQFWNDFGNVLTWTNDQLMDPSVRPECIFLRNHDKRLVVYILASRRNSGDAVLETSTNRSFQWLAYDNHLSGLRRRNRPATRASHLSNARRGARPSGA